MKKMLMTIDTEGLWVDKSTNTALIYNVGWAVHTHDGEIMTSRSYLVKEIFFNQIKTASSRYYQQKTLKYLAMLTNGEIKLASWWEIQAQFAKDTFNYNAKKVLAYNARYDRNSLNYTAHYFGLPEEAEWTSLEWWDTWEMFKTSRAEQVRYKRFCDENNHKTAKGNNKTTAEVATKYLSGDCKFTEDHTALEDVLIEIQIYVACRKMHKKMQRLIKE